MVSAVFIILLMTASLNSDKYGVYFEIEEDFFFSDEDDIWKGEVDSLLRCLQMCAREAACKSANFITKGRLCSLHRETQTMHPENFLLLQGSFYVEKIVSAKAPAILGTTQSSAVPSCKTLLDQYPPQSSGVYWIDPDGGSHANAFKAYCDMETDGGGWTLVWSYTFTDYSNFQGMSSNAITPRPNWQVNSVVIVPISTTPPLNDTDYNAINFSQWKQLGRQILIKSNINNWLICHPGTGSLVDWQEGSVSCQINKHVTDTCSSTLAPSKFSPSPSPRQYGPIFYTTTYFGSTYYYLKATQAITGLPMILVEKAEQIK